MKADIVVLALCLLSLVKADTPANCLYEDILGTWTFLETERTYDQSVTCDTLGPIAYTKIFTLSFPDKVSDELGNTGTWTMVYNQGFEVNINGRSYWAFSYFEGSISYCDQTFNGWARDKTIRNWSCYSATKGTAVTPRIKNTPGPLPMRKFKNDPDMIEKINSLHTTWTSKIYPEFEQYTLEEMVLRAGGRNSIRSPISVAPASEELKSRIVMYPENFDWRVVNGVDYVSPVRDQQACGSCYIFASMASLEARLRIITKLQRTDIFSTQDVVECSLLSQGCAGGFTYLIAGRYAQEQGVVAESCNSYTGTDGTCSTDSTCPKTYVSDYSYVGGYYGACNEEQMIEALLANGPIPVDYEVYSDFYNYDSGIYQHTGVKSDFNPLVGTFSEDTARFYLGEIAVALESLHKIGYIHRDLKLENVLLHGDDHISLTDFGLLKQITNNEDMECCGTTKYMAPEILQGKQYDVAVDVWAYGIMTIIQIASNPTSLNMIHSSLNLIGLSCKGDNLCRLFFRSKHAAAMSSTIAGTEIY